MQKICNNIGAYCAAQKRYEQNKINYKLCVRNDVQKTDRRVNLFIIHNNDNLQIFIIIITCESESKSKKVMECRAKFAVWRIALEIIIMGCTQVRSVIKATDIEVKKPLNTVQNWNVAQSSCSRKFPLRQTSLKNEIVSSKIDFHAIFIRLIIQIYTNLPNLQIHTRRDCRILFSHLSSLCYILRKEYTNGR